MTTSNSVVRKELVVNASQAHAFSVFTERHGSWWPLATHHIGVKPAETAIIEPFVGGRWFERSMDGTECDWGRVLVWEPPARLVLSWEITAGWQHDKALRTEVEVLFIPEGPERTRVRLEHRHLDRYQELAKSMWSILDSDGGWGGIFSRFEGAISGKLPLPLICPASRSK